MRISKRVDGYKSRCENTHKKKIKLSIIMKWGFHLVLPTELFPMMSNLNM